MKKNLEWINNRMSRKELIERLKKAETELKLIREFLGIDK